MKGPYSHLKKKNIYNKTIFVELVKKKHNFLHSMRNRRNKNFQIYVFEQTPELIADLIELSERRRAERW